MQLWKINLSRVYAFENAFMSPHYWAHRTSLVNNEFSNEGKNIPINNEGNEMVMYCLGPRTSPFCIHTIFFGLWISLLSPRRVWRNLTNIFHRLIGHRKPEVRLLWLLNLLNLSRNPCWQNLSFPIMRKIFSSCSTYLRYFK